MINRNLVKEWCLMLHNESNAEDSFDRYTRLITETIQRKLSDGYEIKRLIKKGRYSFYEVKDKENPDNKMTIEATSILWEFTMNHGLDKLYIRLDNEPLVDGLGIVTLEDIIKGTKMYVHKGSTPFIYRRTTATMDLEEYFYGGGRDVDIQDTLRSASRREVKDLVALKGIQSHLLAMLITALVALKLINYGPLEMN